MVKKKIESQDDRAYCKYCKTTYTSTETAQQESCINACKQKIEVYKPAPEILALVDQRNPIVTGAPVAEQIEVLLAMSDLVAKLVILKAAIERLRTNGNTEQQELKTAAIEVLTAHETSLYSLSETVADDGSATTISHARAFIHSTETMMEEIYRLSRVFFNAEDFPNLGLLGRGTGNRTLDISVFPVYGGRARRNVFVMATANRIRVRRDRVNNQPIGVSYGDNPRTARQAGIVMWFIELNTILPDTYIMDRGDRIGRVVSVTEIPNEGQVIAVFLDMQSHLRYDVVALHEARARANERLENSDRRHVESIGPGGLMRLRFSSLTTSRFLSVGTVVVKDNIEIGIIIESNDTGIVMEIDINSPAANSIGLYGHNTELTMISPLGHRAMTIRIDSSGERRQHTPSSEELMRLEIEWAFMTAETEEHRNQQFEEIAESFRQATIIGDNIVVPMPIMEVSLVALAENPEARIEEIAQDNSEPESSPTVLQTATLEEAIRELRFLRWHGIQMRNPRFDPTIRRVGSEPEPQATPGASPTPIAIFRITPALTSGSIPESIRFTERFVPILPDDRSRGLIAAVIQDDEVPGFDNSTEIARRNDSEPEVSTEERTHD